jgi:hypothetical protein
MKRRRIRISKKGFYFNSLFHKYCNLNRGKTPRGISSVKYLSRWYYPNAQNTLPLYTTEDPVYPYISIHDDLNPSLLADGLSLYVFEDFTTELAKAWEIFNPVFVSRVFQNRGRINSGSSREYYSEGYSLLETFSHLSYSYLFQGWEEKSLDRNTLNNFSFKGTGLPPEYSYKRLQTVGLGIRKNGNYVYSFPFVDHYANDLTPRQIISSSLIDGLYFSDKKFYYKSGSTIECIQIWKFWPQPISETSSLILERFIYLGLDKNISPLLLLYIPVITRYLTTRQSITSSVLTPERLFWCGRNSKLSVSYYDTDTSTTGLRYTYTNLCDPSALADRIEALKTVFPPGVLSQNYHYISLSDIKNSVNFEDVSTKDYTAYRCLYSYFTSSSGLTSKRTTIPSDTTLSDYKLFYTARQVDGGAYALMVLIDPLVQRVKSTVEITVADTKSPFTKEENEILFSQAIKLV